MDAEQEFKEYMRSRVFGILAVVKNVNDSSEEFQLCSGVIIESHGYHVLVTVRHYLKELKSWRDDNRLVSLDLVVFREGWIFDLVKLNLTGDEAFFKEDLDIGFIVLSSEMQEQIDRHGGRPLKRTATSLDEIPENLVLVGNAAAYGNLTSDTVSSDKRGAWKVQSVDELSIAFVELDFNEILDKEKATLQLTPKKDIKDYRGTSGGPIFGYKNGALISDYCFFAIQSAQRWAATREAKVKYLIATSAWLAVELINDYIEKLDAER